MGKGSGFGRACAAVTAAVVATAGGGTAVGVATSATAATAATAVSSGAPLYVPAHTGAGGLSNWGGYIAQGHTGEFTTASADWTIAPVHCQSSQGLYAPWVGIDGSGDSTVEQTGVQTECNGSTAVSSAWYEMYPASPVYFSDPVATGDAFSASVTYTGSAFELTISDTSKGWTHTVTKSLRSAERLSAEAVVEAPGGFPAGLTSVSFTNVRFDGKPLAQFHPSTTRTAGPGGSVYGPGKITNGTNFTIKKS